MKFSLLHTDPNTKARAGIIETDHGKIETPIFMPVGTAGTVKGTCKRYQSANNFRKYVSFIFTPRNKFIRESRWTAQIHWMG